MEKLPENNVTGTTPANGGRVSKQDGLLDITVNSVFANTSKFFSLFDEIKDGETKGVESTPLARDFALAALCNDVEADNVRASVRPFIDVMLAGPEEIADIFSAVDLPVIAGQFYALAMRGGLVIMVGTPSESSPRGVSILASYLAPSTDCVWPLFEELGLTPETVENLAEFMAVSASFDKSPSLYALDTPFDSPTLMVRDLVDDKARTTFGKASLKKAIQYGPFGENPDAYRLEVIALGVVALCAIADRTFVTSTDHLGLLTRAERTYTNYSNLDRVNITSSVGKDKVPGISESAESETIVKGLKS